MNITINEYTRRITELEAQVKGRDSHIASLQDELHRVRAALAAATQKGVDEATPVYQGTTTLPDFRIGTLTTAYPGGAVNAADTPRTHL